MTWVVDDIANMIAAQQADAVQQENAKKAMGIQTSTYNQSRADQLPWLQGGQQSLQNLMQQMNNGGFDLKYQGVNMDPSSLQNDPGYQFRMQQGQQALQRSAAAKGGLNSGAFMKGLDRYSQGFASNEYQNAWNRNYQGAQAQNQFNLTNTQNRFGHLFQMAGMGQNSAQNLGQLGQNYANNMSGLYGAIGNARAAGITGTAKWAGQAGEDGANTMMQLYGGGGMGGMGGGGGGQSVGSGQLNYGQFSGGGQVSGGIPTQSAYGRQPQGYDPNSIYPNFGTGE